MIKVMTSGQKERNVPSEIGTFHECSKSTNGSAKLSVA